MEQKDRFSGNWTDKTGKILVVASDSDKLQVDFYKNLSLEPVSRKMADGAPSLSLKMTSYFQSSELIVELGTEGIGATLHLNYHIIDGKECLIPELEHGLYGDNEDDFGIPWLFPLNIYHRIKR